MGRAACLLPLPRSIYLGPIASAYRRSGLGDAFRAGLWQYIYDEPNNYGNDDGNWYRLVPDEIVHVDTVGIPTGTPGENERFSINDRGEVYPVVRETHTVNVAAQATSAPIVDAKYDRAPETYAAMWANVGAWGFTFARGDDRGQQFRRETIGAISQGIEWRDIWQGIIDNTNPNAARLATLTTYRDGLWLGHRSNDTAAAEQMTALGITEDDFNNGPHVYFNQTIGNEPSVRRVTSYTPGQHYTETDRHYAGRLAEFSEVPDPEGERLVPEIISRRLGPKLLTVRWSLTGSL